ncbi:MAG TPA: phosphotransferase [Roseiflexaceae bacterium]
MTIAAEPRYAPIETATLDGLELFAELPDWLVAIVRPERVRSALERVIPEFASGELALQGCEIRRMRIKKDRWIGIFQLTVGETHSGPSRLVQMQGMLFPPTTDDRTGTIYRASTTDEQPSIPFGIEGWRCYVPELRLLLETQPPEVALLALPVLTDPEQSRATLERGIRDGGVAYQDFRIQSCAPNVVRYKPGSRCTIVYRLAYLPEHAGHGWPALVVAKTYKGDKGRNAYAGMRRLWESPLGTSDVVTIAEPLAFIPEVNLLVQGPIREEQTLKDLIRSALRAGTPDALAELDDYMRKTARGLAALHRSGARHGDTTTWEDELAEVREVVEQLADAIPQLADAAASLLARLEALAAAHPPDPAVPSHRSFRPGQVLLNQGKIGFIDFDSFGQAEPALDLALFLSAMKNIGLSEPHEEESSEDDAALDDEERLATLVRLEAICETFLAEYEQAAPISRQRVALWEALDLLSLTLTCWTKIKPVRLSNTMLMLERYLSQTGIS